MDFIKLTAITRWSGLPDAILLETHFFDIFALPKKTNNKINSYNFLCDFACRYFDSYWPRWLFHMMTLSNHHEIADLRPLLIFALYKIKENHTLWSVARLDTW